MRYLAALFMVVLAATACGGSEHQTAAKPKPSPTYADPECPVVLAVIPAHPPGTARQAGDISRELSVDQGIGSQLKSGTLLRSLAFTVGADAFKLTFDMTGLTGNASGDLASYNSDVAQLRQYCKG